MCTSHRAAQRSSFALRLFTAGGFPAGWMLPKIILCAAKYPPTQQGGHGWTEGAWRRQGCSKAQAPSTPKSCSSHTTHGLKQGYSSRRPEQTPSTTFWFYFSFLDAFLGLEQPQRQNKEDPDAPQPVPGKAGFASSATSQPKSLYKKDE